MVLSWASWSILAVKLVLKYELILKKFQEDNLRQMCVNVLFFTLNCLFQHFYTCSISWMTQKIGKLIRKNIILCIVFGEKNYDTRKKFLLPLVVRFATHSMFANSIKNRLIIKYLVFFVQALHFATLQKTLSQDRSWPMAKHVASVSLVENYW